MIDKVKNVLFLGCMILCTTSFAKDEEPQYWSLNYYRYPGLKISCVLKDKSQDPLKVCSYYLSNFLLNWNRDSLVYNAIASTHDHSRGLISDETLKTSWDRVSRTIYWEKQNP